MTTDVALINPVDMWNGILVIDYPIAGGPYKWRHEHKHMQYMLLCDYADGGGNLITNRLQTIHIILRVSL